MIRCGETLCPKCGGQLAGYDHVKRTLRIGNGEKQLMTVKRFKCKRCGAMHTELPSDILPYKQYRADIIQGFQDGDLSTSELAYEDYPCDLTVRRWSKVKAKPR